MSPDFDMIAHGIVVHHSDAPTRPDLGPAITEALRSAHAAGEASGAAKERAECATIARAVAEEHYWLRMNAAPGVGVSGLSSVESAARHVERTICARGGSMDDVADHIAKELVP